MGSFRDHCVGLSCWFLGGRWHYKFWFVLLLFWLCTYALGYELMVLILSLLALPFYHFTKENNLKHKLWKKKRKKTKKNCEKSTKERRRKKQQKKCEWIIGIVNSFSICIMGCARCKGLEYWCYCCFFGALLAVP